MPLFRTPSPVQLCTVLALALAALATCDNDDLVNGEEAAASTPAPGVPTYGYRIVGVFPHDTGAFTQGLVFVDGEFLESTGGGAQATRIEEPSSLRRVAIETGEVLQIISLDDRFFGEGIALFDEQIYMLTWRSRVAFLFNRDDFDQIGEFAYPTQGWGLTQDGKQLIMSDGTANLYFRRPGTFESIGEVEVHHEGNAIRNLNELEYIEGEVWANVWTADRIARINPATGKINSWVDFSDLLTTGEAAEADVLNGIAYDAEFKRIFVTGKLWPWVFEVAVVGDGSSS
ncbi:MAG: glutaminyl-peptide cyclotransferase [Candidatus Latescibacterota bacterium]|nr:glutaminyl-peptide cyclotransferase [Candidatus Latescibacterota bacterium]